MDKHLKVSGFFLCLMILSAMALVLNFSNPKSQETLYVTKIDLAKEIFRDPTEKLVIVTKGLRVFIYSSGEGHQVTGSRSQLYEHLKDNGIEVEDIAIIIHNHFSPASFSPDNNKTYHYFKNRGFKGFFSIYYPANKKTRTKKE